jgi:hypothetical protein
MSHPRLSGSGPRHSLRLESDGRNTAGQARERNAPLPLRKRKCDWSPERYLWASDAAQSIIPADLQAQSANNSFKAKGGTSRYLVSPICGLQPRRIVTRPGPVHLEAWFDVVENLAKTHLLVLNKSPMWHIIRVLTSFTRGQTRRRVQRRWGGSKFRPTPNHPAARRLGMRMGPSSLASKHQHPSGSQTVGALL